MATEIHVQVGAAEQHILDFRHYESAALYERAAGLGLDLAAELAERLSHDHAHHGHDHGD